MIRNMIRNSKSGILLQIFRIASVRLLEPLPKHLLVDKSTHEM